jgi:hypothetical protein
MTRPDHTAVPPADVIAAAKPVLRELLMCFYSWEPDVRVLGNVRAGDAVDAIAAALTLADSGIAAAIRHEVAQWEAGFVEADTALRRIERQMEALASHAPNATLAASPDAESATSGATSAAKVEVDLGELAALRRDAARYRWAQDKGCNFVWAEIGAGNFRTGLDREIDRAMAKSE